MVFEIREISGDIPEIVNHSQQIEPDLKPEDTRYRDEGCVYAASCLKCPYPGCIFDETRGRQRWLKEIRYREINKFHAKGWDYGELAMLFGVSARTVQRAVNEKQATANKRKIRRMKRDERDIDGAAGAHGPGAV